MKKLLLGFIIISVIGCGKQSAPSPVSNNGVKKANVEVQTGTDGLTNEQRNIQDRLLADNKPGAIKHLYIISAYSGQTLIYSTVRGKVTSSGKRLSPTTVVVTSGGQYADRLRGYNINNKETAEVLQDDGTYGSSIEYLYWWDSKGVYHQHYINGGQIAHISDQPLSVGSVTINMEIQK